MTRTEALWLSISLMVPASADAEIVVGPWTFQETAFADDATQLDAGSSILWCASDLDDALTGFSPDRQLVNVGTTNLYQLDFVDQKILNFAGADFVFFDARFSADPYELAVRRVGGVFSSYVLVDASQFVDTGLTSCPTSTAAKIYGAAVDLDAFGLPGGTAVDAIRFRALPISAAGAQGDPVMAAALTGCGGCYGAGCPGTGGYVPTLTSFDVPTAGGPLTLVIDDGLGGVTAFLFVGLGAASIPAGAGCDLLLNPLLPVPLPIPLGGVGPGNGTATLATTAPASASGVTVTLQAFLPDAGSPTGFSNSNGVLLAFP